LHAVRDAWRKRHFEQWLTRTTKGNAGVARGQGLQYNKAILDNVKAVVAKLSEHDRAVAVGGMTTEATTDEPAAYCNDCRSAVVPSVDHVLWHCPAYAHLRGVTPPGSALARCLGWDANTAGEPRALLAARLEQMGRIREAEAAARKARVACR
jgi:hypothetical protein